MEKLISRKEAAKLLGISIATLDAARNSGLISYVQYVQNGCVYFTDAGLQEYIAKCTHRAKASGKKRYIPQAAKCPSLSCSVSLLEPNMSDKTKVQRWTLFLGGGRNWQKRKRAIPQYGTVVLNGIEYYRTRVEDSDGNRVALYAKTPEKLYDKELEALEQIDSTTFRRRSPTVAEYCEKWLLMQSVHVRATTLTDYTSKVRRHIIGGLGDKRMADVSLDDIQLCLVILFPRSRLRFISLW